MIFNLPRPLHHHVLEFLDFKSVVRVDSAHMQDRRYFPRVFLRDFTVKVPVLLNASNGLWFWLRGALLENVIVGGSAGYNAFSNIMVHQGHALRVVDFSKCDFETEPVEGAFLEELHTFCPNIERMNFSGVNLSAYELTQLVKNRSNLLELNLSWSGDAFDGDVLNCLWSNCTALQKLNLTGTTICDEGLLYLVGKKTVIAELDLDDVAGLTNLGLATIFNACPLLINLDLSGHKISNAALYCLAQSCPLLESLSVDLTNASDQSIIFLATACPDIDTLDFDNTDITDETLSVVAEKFPKMIFISLSNCPVLTNNGLLHIALYCSKLSYLNISNTNISYRTVRTLLGKCASLSKLILHDCPGATNDNGEVVSEYIKND